MLPVAGLMLMLSLTGYKHSWGFFAHQKINYHAVFTLPPEMIRFFKSNIDYLTAEAVAPDRRRYSVEGEAPRHYIDLELYETPLDSLPYRFDSLLTLYPEDSVQAFGILPWNLLRMKYQLTEAMRVKDKSRILRYAADLGHYIADANVPLHTTENYNGQLTGQEGIHRFWETRLPELFFEEYDLITGRARYIRYPARTIWQIIGNAHAALDSVLRLERELSLEIPEDRRYVFESRGLTMVREFSEAYARRYHEALSGMVERQLRSSIHWTGSFWYTCWIDAGQPDLSELGAGPVIKEEEPLLLQPERTHEH